MHTHKCIKGSNLFCWCFTPFYYGQYIFVLEIEDRGIKRKTVKRQHLFVREIKDGGKSESPIHFCAWNWRSWKNPKKVKRQCLLCVKSKTVEKKPQYFFCVKSKMVEKSETPIPFLCVFCEKSQSNKPHNKVQGWIMLTLDAHTQISKVQTVFVGCFAPFNYGQYIFVLEIEDRGKKRKKWNANTFLCVKSKIVEKVKPPIPFFCVWNQKPEKKWNPNTFFVCVFVKKSISTKVRGWIMLTLKKRWSRPLKFLITQVCCCCCCC